MVSVVPFVVWLALLIFCLIDIDATQAGRIRGVSQPWWLLVVVLVPVLGSLAWIVGGRPRPVGVRPHVAVLPPQGGVETTGGPGGISKAAPGSPAVAALDRALGAELQRIDREFEEAVRRRREGLRGGDGRPRG